MRWKRLTGLAAVDPDCVDEAERLGKDPFEVDKEYDHSLVRRVYVPEGKRLWPRVSLSVYGPETWLYKHSTRGGFTVSWACKEKKGEWWDSHGDIPLQLMDELIEMLQEAKSVIAAKERVGSSA